METKEMCKQNGVLKRGNTYYFQARIPQDCREIFPKEGIREKLSATTLAEAKAQVRKKWAELKARIERLRAGAVSELPDAEIQRYADAWLSSVLERDEEVRLEGLDDRELPLQPAGDLLRRPLERELLRDSPS